MGLQFDMTGVAPWNPLSSPAPEPGPYKGKVMDVDPAYNGGKSTKFTIDLLAGPSAGQTTDLYIGNEPGEKGGNKRKWRQALEAVGDPAKLAAVLQANNGQIAFDQVATFKGKEIHVLVIAVPGQDAQGRQNLPNKEFLTKAQYDQVMAAHGAGSNGAAGAHAPAGAPPAVAAPAAGKVLDDLFGQK